MKYSVMLAKLGNKNTLSSQDFIFEPKFDGTRVLVYKQGKSIRLVNRRERDITHRYPELRSLWKDIKVRQAVLDGELVVLREGKPDFNALQRREQQEQEIAIAMLSKEMPATIFVFDVLEHNGKQTLDLPLIKRKLLLRKLVHNSSRIVICPYTNDGRKLWRNVRRLGLEGVIAKRKLSRYEPGKISDAWLKIKNLKTVDAVVVGFTKGKGKREHLFGSLLLAAYRNNKLVYIGNVGTGFSHETACELLAKMKKLSSRVPCLSEQELYVTQEKHGARARDITWIKPKIVIEVKYLDLTKDMKLRAPVFLRLREDKIPEECVI